VTALFARATWAHLSLCSKQRWTDALLVSAVAGACGARACGAQLLRWLVPFAAAAQASALAAQAAACAADALAATAAPTAHAPAARSCCGCHPRRVLYLQTDAARTLLTGAAGALSRARVSLRGWPLTCRDAWAGGLAQDLPARVNPTQQFARASLLFHHSCG